MEIIKVKPGDTIAKIATRFRVSTADMIKANPRLKHPDRIYPGQMINVPVPARHSQGGSSAGASVAAGTGGDPTQDAKYIENAVAAVGLPIWGGPFYLYRNVANGRGIDALVLPRNEVTLDFDPLKASSFELRSIRASLDLFFEGRSGSGCIDLQNAGILLLLQDEWRDHLSDDCV